MNIKINFYIINTVSLLFLGNIFIGQLCFSKPPITDFRQLSNQELFEDSDYSTVPLEKKEEAIAYHRYCSQSGYDKILKLHSPEVYSKYPPDSVFYDKSDMTFLQQLGWYVETNKSSYQCGEDVEIQLSLKNISDQDVSIRTYPFGINDMIFSIELKKKVAGQMQSINLTKQGVQERRVLPDTYASNLRRLPRSHFYTLKPGEKGLLDQQMKNLNRFYDLSASGEYELMFYTRYFIGINQVAAYPKPCTIHFKIEDTENEQKETTTQE